jgi:NAD(P)-dependent dehydrogenase (short-subunit alcohol dehydrogenase family)
MAKALVEKGIRVNGVAPGPIWTPLFLASEDASYMSGQVLHPNGGTVVNG